MSAVARQGPFFNPGKGGTTACTGCSHSPKGGSKSCAVESSACCPVPAQQLRFLAEELAIRSTSSLRKLVLLAHSVLSPLMQSPPVLKSPLCSREPCALEFPLCSERPCFQSPLCWESL